MSSTDYRPALLDWWDRRCRAYLLENFGAVESEIREQLSALLFPRAAEPTLPEQTLPVAFLHLRLLAGEELAITLKRLEGMAALYGMRGAKPKVGTIYMCLTALTSTPGRLSSLARAQTAFFSLLLRRVADHLDRGAGEEEIRRELMEVWEIGEGAAAAALESARSFWRRTQEPHQGLLPLPFDIEEWFGRSGLPSPAGRANRFFPPARDYPHLLAMAERIAAMDVLQESAESVEEGQIRVALIESIARGMEGLTPWEAEALRPVHPLLHRIREWAERLRLVDGGETPTAHPGRERLPDWIGGYLQSLWSGEGHVVAGRISVGGWTYIAAGIRATAPGETASASLLPPLSEAPGRMTLRVRFGDGSEEALLY
ncbi:MAG: hypothetical protein O2807_10065, partial [bacterium]|nr:hypothetical protein [bacterium]